MYYLVDTNVFLHAIKESVCSVAQLCKKMPTMLQSRKLSSMS